MSSVKSLIEKHTGIANEIEKLEEEKYSLQDEILKEIDGFSKDELYEIYPKLVDSSLKFKVFKMIKEE